MKKKLHYLDLAQQRQRKYSERSSLSLPYSLFAKYFPKYQKKFTLINKNGAIQSKIKRTKIIKSFEMLQKRSYWRILLANKMKSVKSLSANKFGYSKQFAEKLKDLLGLRSARMEMVLAAAPSSPFGSQNKQEEFFLKKICKNFQRALNLQSLLISSVSLKSRDNTKRLNAHKRVLDSLKTLKFLFDWTDASDSEISELIENSKNLLRNVTSLRLNTLHSNFHFESFQKLGELCPKVSALSFDFSCRDIVKQKFGPKRFSNECFEVKINFLQILKDFQHLKYLNLGIGDIFTFLKDFALSPSIQSLRLEFQDCLSKKIMLKIDENFIDDSKFWEENNLLRKFYDNFKGLDHLENLEFLFGLGSNQEETYKYPNYLFQSLLKRISSPLKRLVVFPSLFSSRFNPIPIISKIEDSSLPDFIESCGNFAMKLETLNIGYQHVIYSDFDLSAYRNKFPNLSHIEVKANFCQSQGANIEKIGSFLEHFVNLGESITFIKLKAKMNGGFKSFLSVLKQMNQLKKPEKLKIGLEWNLEKVEELGMTFIDAINKLKSNKASYSKVINVSFGIDYAFSRAQELYKFMKLYQEKFDQL